MLPEQQAPANLVTAKAFELLAEVMVLKDTPLFQTFLEHKRRREAPDGLVPVTDAPEGRLVVT